MPFSIILEVLSVILPFLPLDDNLKKSKKSRQEMVKQLNVRRENWLCRLYLRWGTLIFQGRIVGVLYRCQPSHGSPCSTEARFQHWVTTAGEEEQAGTLRWLVCAPGEALLWGLPAMTACVCRLRAVSKAAVLKDPEEAL